MFKLFLKTTPYFKLDKQNYYYIEEPLKAFKQNASMAQTIAILQRFNAVCSYGLYELTGIEPTHINVTTARARCGCSVPRGTKAKPFIFSHVKSLKAVPDHKWMYKKTGTPKDWCYDQADSYIVAKAGFKIFHEKET